MTHGHRDFTVCSCSSLPVLLPGVAGPPAALKCSTTAVVSGEPVMRSARTNARRRIAASRHCGSGCNQAPRPGSFLAESTVTAHSPFPSSTATTRSSSTASSRFRQPTHVRTGPSGRRCGATAEVSRWITAESTVTAPAKRNGSTWDVPQSRDGCGDPPDRFVPGLAGVAPIYRSETAPWDASG